MSMVSEKQMHLAGAAGGQLPAGIAGEKKKTNQGGWFYFTLGTLHYVHTGKNILTSTFKIANNLVASG